MPAALSDDEIEDRYFVLGPKPIIAMLGQFIYKSIPVTVLFNSGNDFILTTLLEARPESLVFDLGGDTQANQRLLKADTCTFVTAVNGIRVQFTTKGGVRQVWWGDANALAVSLPTRVIRLQRREAYRMVMPMIKSIPVSLCFGPGGSGQDASRPIHDLSVSGLGISLTQRPQRAPGEAIPRITFSLPEHHQIACTGAIRRVTDIAEGPNSHSCRIGVSFADVPRPMEIAIQRYIIALERSRHEMAAGST